MFAHSIRPPRGTARRSRLSRCPPGVAVRPYSFQNPAASRESHRPTIALGPERQEQQNVRKLRGLDTSRWERLVNLIDQHGNQAALEEVSELLDLDVSKQEAEAVAARSNMTAIVRMMHDKSSQLMDLLLDALSRSVHSPPVNGRLWADSLFS